MKKIKFPKGTTYGEIFEFVALEEFIRYLNNEYDIVIDDYENKIFKFIRDKLERQVKEIQNEKNNN